MSEDTNHKESENRFDDIFVDESAIDRKRVAAILNGYAEVGKESGRLVPSSAYDDLTAKDKILITLVAERAKEIRGDVESASLGPATISERSGVAEGTVKPNVRELADDGLIYDGQDGYSVEPPELKRIEERLENHD